MNNETLVMQKNMHLTNSISFFAWMKKVIYQMSRAVFSLKIHLSGDNHQEHIFAGISWNSDQVEPKLFCWIITS